MIIKFKNLVRCKQFFKIFFFFQNCLTYEIPIIAQSIWSEKIIYCCHNLQICSFVHKSLSLSLFYTARSAGQKGCVNKQQLVVQQTDPSKVCSLVTTKSKVYTDPIGVKIGLWPLRCPQRYLEFFHI